jgi:hypothetical protein
VTGESASDEVSQKEQSSPTQDLGFGRICCQSFKFFEDMAGTQHPSSLPDALRVLCPNTPAGLLQCPQCKVVPSGGWREDRKFQWARVLYCNCGRNWVVCGYCNDGFDRHLKSKREMGVHDRKVHRAQKKTDGKRTRTKDPPELVMSKKKE